MLISGETTVDRKVTLVVSESKDVGSVGVVICDYNKDELINGTDYMSFIAFYNKTVNYNSVTLK